MLIDPEDRVLLVHGHDPAAPQTGRWWCTPGGGMRPGEDPLAALRRECHEELGFAPARIAGPVAERTDEFVFDNRLLVQRAAYYWARVPAFEPSPQRLSDLELRSFLGFCWWPTDALRATTETVYPCDLPMLIEWALAGVEATWDR